MGCVKFFYARGRPGGAGPPNVNFGPFDISETIRARKLNLKIPLDVVKYPLWVQKYIMQYNMRAAAILTFDKCLYLRGRLRLTTARRLSASCIVESASDDYMFKMTQNLISEPF